MEPCAAASMTKVSKPVLFALKMTDFQYAHKLDSSLVNCCWHFAPDEPQAYFHLTRAARGGSGSALQNPGVSEPAHQKGAFSSRGKAPFKPIS